MPDPLDPTALGDDLRHAWHRYVDLLTPLRPALHAYCRRLTGNLWDAEDLAQETLLRAFGQWGLTTPAIRDPRAYLLRIATNLWIDTLRRRRNEARAPLVAPDFVASPGPPPDTASDVRDAGAHLLQHLSPQERAAVVLKEVYDMPLVEIADLLATTTGAVKAALHRARDRLAAGTTAGKHRPAPSAELVDRFIDRFHASDVPGLVALMLDGAVAENVGNSVHIGLDPEVGVPRFLAHVVHGHRDWPPAVQWDGSRMQRVEIEGEAVALYIVTHGSEERLMALLRFEEHDGRIARIRSYGFCPETIGAVGELLGMPVWTGLYRAPTPTTPAGS